MKKYKSVLLDYATWFKLKNFAAKNDKSIREVLINLIEKECN